MIAKSIIIAISLINIIVASIVIYKQRRGKKVESKPNPYLFDIIFIGSHLFVSFIASVTTISLALPFAQKQLEHPIVASIMLFNLQLAFLLIKYFDAFNSKPEIEYKNFWIKAWSKITLTSIIFWSLFVVIIIPSGLENTEKFVSLQKEKLVQDTSAITLTDYESQLAKLKQEISEWKDKAKPLNDKKEKAEKGLGKPLTEKEINELDRANYFIWKKGKDYDDTFKLNEAQNKAINKQKNDEAEKKLQREKNKIDFIFDSARIFWALALSILSELASAWFTTKGSKRLANLIQRIKDDKEKQRKKEERYLKKLEKENLKNKKIEEPQDITISNQSVKEFTDIVHEIKNNMEKPNVEITGDGNNIPEIIEEHTDIPITVDEEPDQVNPELIKKLDTIEDNFEFNDNWEITDDELVTNYNPESYNEKVEPKENLDYNDYNKLVEKNSSKKEPVESGLGISKPVEEKVPVIQYSPKTSKKKVKETRIPIENILDDNEIYPQRNSVLKHRD